MCNTYCFSTATMVSPLPRLLFYVVAKRQSRWPCRLRLISAAAWLRVSWVWIPLRTWMFMSCVCCVGSGLCDGMMIRSEEFCLGCVCVWSRNMKTRRPRPDLGCCERKKWLLSLVWRMHWEFSRHHSCCRVDMQETDKCNSRTQRVFNQQLHVSAPQRSHHKD